MAEDTSSESGAMPASDTSAKDTASGSAMPPTKPALTLEEVLKRNAELEHSHLNAKEELERHRKKLSAYEKAEKEAEANKKAAEEAQLSEIERTKKQYQELEQKVQQYQKQLVMAQVKLAAKDKNIIDPDLAAMAIQDKLELGDDGMPTNLDAVLKDLVKQKPYLVAVTAEPAPTPATPAETATPPTFQTPAIPAMNPGRSSIQQPGSTPPGKIPTLDDYYASKRR